MHAKSALLDILPVALASTRVPCILCLHFHLRAGTSYYFLGQASKCRKCACAMQSIAKMWRWGWGRARNLFATYITDRCHMPCTVAEVCHDQKQYNAKLHTPHPFFTKILVQLWPAHLCRPCIFLFSKPHSWSSPTMIIICTLQYLPTLCNWCT